MEERWDTIKEHDAIDFLLVDINDTYEELVDENPETNMVLRMET